MFIHLQAYRLNVALTHGIMIKFRLNSFKRSDLEVYDD